MANLNDAISRLRVAPTGRIGETSSLRSLRVVGPNPGGLAAKVHIPADLPAGAPLVVALHGCTQTANAYDTGIGWSRLADRAGFALLLPQQSAMNNPNLCFNWFQAGDVARRGGEAESIALMVAELVGRHALDAERVFVTGLSAGGAMAAVMLATYPDVFAGGAIIGGLPVGCATGVGAALQLMAGRGRVGPAAAIDAARSAAGHVPKRWPSVSLWHGTADRTVVVGNMEDLAAQWRGVHGADLASGRTAWDGAVERRSWSIDGRVVVETRSIAGMGHGVPIDPSSHDGLGRPGPYMLSVGVDSTTEIARSWDILPAAGGASAATRTSAARPADLPAAAGGPPMPTMGGYAPLDVGKVIEDALRSAGLMR